MQPAVSNFQTFLYIIRRYSPGCCVNIQTLLEGYLRVLTKKYALLRGLSKISWLLLRLEK